MLPTINQSGKGLYLTICHRALYGKRKKVVRQRHRKSAQPSAPRKRQKAASGRHPSKRRRETVNETDEQTVIGDNDSGVGTSAVGGGNGIHRGRSTRRGYNSESGGGSSESDHEEDEGEFERGSEESSGEESEEDSEGEDVDYEVNAILDKRVNAETSEFEYLINWVNFNDDWNT